jgi:serine protease
MSQINIRTHHLLAILCIALFFFFTEAYTQRLLGDNVVKTGTWKNSEIEYISGEILIIFKPGVSENDISSVLEPLPGMVVQPFDKLGFGKLQVPDSINIFSLIEFLEKNPLIKAAEPNMIGTTADVPNDPYFNGTTPATYRYQWGLQNIGQNPPSGKVGADIHIINAWGLWKGTSNDTIAILDSGIPTDLGTNNLNHQDLNDPSRFITGPDYSPVPDAYIRDEHKKGHGSHVAGIIAAETDNGIGIAGVAWNCTAIIIQVFYGGDVTHNGFRNAVVWAVDHGAKIINFSGGFPDSSATLIQAVEYAQQHDRIIVAAAHNYNGPVRYPARYSSTYSNVIAVGSTDHNDQRSSYSDFGPELDVVAPGGYGSWPDANDICSTIPTYNTTYPEGQIATGYAYMGGTSMATPMVAGLASLVRSRFPFFTASQVRDRIRQSADDVNGYTSLGRDDSIGFGRINAYRALSGTPATPILSSPANNCTTAYNIATLIWHTATWATSYHLQVDDENTFTSPLIKDIQSITDTQWTDAYSPNSRYYWRVWAVNNSGSGDTSIIWSFITGPAPPSISLNWVASTLPTIKKPCGQSCNPTYSDCYPKLSWSFQNGAVGPCDIYRYHCPSEGGDCGGPAQLMVDNQSGTCWVDQGVIVIRPGQSPITTFYYYVVGNGGVGPQSNKVAVNTIMAWKIDDDFVINSIPATTQLIGNYPNPFNPTTTISYDLSEDVHVILKIYDILGREVMTLVNENQTAGRKSVELFAINLESGFYLYRLEAGKYTEMKKMLLIK